MQGLGLGRVNLVRDFTVIKLHKGITMISKEQGILEKRIVKVEKVIDEMENGNIPNAAMKKIENKIDERLKAANENMNQSVKKVVTESVDAANKSVVKHLSEQERRKFNLMIFRVRESNSEEANELSMTPTNSTKSWTKI